jgi:hypothetical protein
MRRNLKKKTRKDTQLKFYKTMAVPVLMYGSEAWTIKKKDISRIQSTEMKFSRSVKRCTMDYIRNEEIRTELEMYAIQGKITEYRIHWSAHLQRMDNSRLPKQALLYKPRGRRDVGYPRKRWTANVRTGDSPIPRSDDDDVNQSCTMMNILI